MQTRYTSADQWADAKDGVIPAPYALEEGEQIIDQYLEPVIFHNVNGPDIGVTTCGVIVKDGLYFKDLDNSGELAPYKDWRLSPEQRAEDMVKHLRLDQQAGLVLNTLFNTPVVPTRAEATNAEGKLELGKIYKHHNPGEKPMPGPLPGMTVSIDDSHVLEKHIAAGVYRGDMRCEAGMVALYHNAGTQMLEYEACKGGVAIPYSLHTNPINIGYPDSLGIGAAVIGDGNTDPENIVKAVEDGLLPKADLDRASYNRLLSLFRTKRVDNPYLDPDKADQARVDNFDGAKKKAYEANQKAVVLVKNHEKLLPLAKSQKVCIVTFKGVDSGFAQMAQAMGAGLGNTDEDAALRKTLTEAFEKKGYTVVATPEEADVLYLHVWPISNGLVFNQYAMPVIEMGEIVTDERERNKSQKKTGNKVTVVTLKDVEKIKELADAIHARGGKVVGTCVVCNPWLLDKLEPYCDALTIQYTVSAVALNNALNAQVDVISGDFAPTGKLSLTMVSDPAVIAITEQEIDGVVREICASPNDVPGYDKDQYIDPAILANVKGGSYAYCDADGNYYRSGFGLNY